MKNFIKTCLFFALLIPMFMVGSKIFAPKNNADMHEASANGILGEKENTIDVLFLGNSIIYTSIIPMQLWQDYGYTSYISGTPGQYINTSYKYLEKALKNQKPKIVVLDADVIFGGIPKKNLLSLTIHNNIPLVEYHDRWKNLQIDDFYENSNYSWTDPHKGYYYVTDVKPYIDENDYMKETSEFAKMPLVNKYYLKKIEKLCSKNNIELIFLSSPSPTFWNYSKHNTMSKYASEHNYKYVDINLLLEEVGINWNEDSLDNGMHINYNGAVKVTKYFGDYLKNLELLGDHRKDDTYDEWNEVTEIFYQNVKGD